jgi:sulfoxide reductase catalytic subunit YedY
MLIRKPTDVKSSEITPYQTYLNRRHFIGRSAMAAIAAAAVPGALAACDAESASGQTQFGQDRDWSKTRSEIDEELTSFEDVTSYNNFYEFGTGKDDPARNAHTLETRSWSIAVEGHVAKPAVYNLEDFVAPHTIEERVYRLRCVEAWSMVIPWRGFPLADLVRRVEPTSKAKYVEFVTLLDPGQMPGQRRRIIDWPYVEGLRLDEAMHPLTFMATGLYGRDLPNQNSTPM